MPLPLGYPSISVEAPSLPSRDLDRLILSMFDARQVKGPETPCLWVVIATNKEICCRTVVAGNLHRESPEEVLR